MEDDSELELSLGLSFGGSSSKFKVKGNSSDPKSGDASASRLMGSNVAISDDSFKNFFKSGPENQEPKGKHKSDAISQLQENFFTDLGKSPASAIDCSNNAQNSVAQFKRYQEQLIASNKIAQTEEEKLGSNKRKHLFEEISFQNKHEKSIAFAEKQVAQKSFGSPLPRNSHVSNTTEDGSTGENEDVAESVAEGPQSWLPTHREQNAKCAEIFRFDGKITLSESSDIDFHGLTQPCLSRKEFNPEHGKPTFGVPLPLQSLKIMNFPYPVPATIPSTSSGSNASGFISTSAMKLMPIANGERSMVPTENSNNTQLAFGYPTSHLPTLEAGSSWAFNCQPLHLSSFNSRDQSIGVQFHEHFEDGVKASQETGVSARSEDQSHSRNNAVLSNEAMNISPAEDSSREGPVIKPGIAPNLRFGGCGSYPDLPWVSTTGQGPNGRTISGVTYKYNQNQIKIVCACHGTHMSPEEFIQHASADVSNSENNQNLASFFTSNTTSSAQG